MNDIQIEVEKIKEVLINDSSANIKIRLKNGHTIIVWPKFYLNTDNTLAIRFSQIKV